MISNEEWKPVGVEDLEQVADDVVRSSSNILVVAGPGAGKTELLAQRANFLLTTNSCPFPQRVLAVSFKRDAAKNLADRVKARAPDFASRFDSLTLDAFAKQLVDRFYPALPAEWRPKPDYLVRVSSFSQDEARNWFRNVWIPEGVGRPDMHGKTKDVVMASLDKVMHGAPIPFEVGTSKLHEALAKQWWKERLAFPIETPSLTFAMLNRLAAYLLRMNPKIAKILQASYSHVFLDEFQDTTPSQWELIQSAFGGSNAVLTAVGDTKQRIMVWAGADPDIFTKFKDTFKAEKKELLRNYRSVPELVEIQHKIALIVEDGSAKPESAKKSKAQGECRILAFQSTKSEAEYVAEYIRKGIAGGMAPRDFCVLVRQQTGQMIETLQQQMAALGIAIRDETFLQDLIAEPITKVVLYSLRLGASPRDPEAWSELSKELSYLSGLDEREDAMALEQLTTAHKYWTADFIAGGGNLGQYPAGIIQLAGAERYRGMYRQYMNGNFLEKTAEDVGKALLMSFQKVGNIQGVVAEFSGTNTVPAMSIHKSKGLEFKIVIFIGLEDEQWWNFAKQPEEEKRAFFVAFSRAIEKVIFTYSRIRTKEGRSKTANIEQVGTLLEVLKQAGVQTEELA